MRIQTAKFGEIDVNDELIFDFVEPIIGYDNLRKYILVEHNDNSVFKWLQSIEDSELAFPVSSPAYFDIDYQFEISDELADKINLESVESLISLNIVTIPQLNPQKATINLLAPIIINADNKKGLQMILSNSNYPVKYPLFKDEEQE